jgi:UDP-4-amino-4,6-dideoxy-N-acetyl-beta-L-altrosamine transaminase
MRCVHPVPDESAGSCPEADDFIPYGRQSIDAADIQSVVEVLCSDYLTTGPRVEAFEKSISEYVGTGEAVALSSGTAALHAAMYALEIGPGDEVILPPLTFVATANAIVYQGGTPVFADVVPGTLLVDPDRIVEKITSKTRAVIAVDYAGQPCDYDSLHSICSHYGLFLVSDACHALGSEYKHRRVGGLADVSVFSFHPVKHITTGEGGMVTTDAGHLAGRMKNFRNHGITTDHRQREQNGSWGYEMVDIGYNYRITDIQCTLGLSQMVKLPAFLQRRHEIAECYDDAFSKSAVIKPLEKRPEVCHAYHLYVVKLDGDGLGIGRDKLFKHLRKKGIGVNVHYMPVHLHPFYKREFGTGNGLCPNAEQAYETILSLPIFPGLTDIQVEKVIRIVNDTADSLRT